MTDDTPSRDDRDVDDEAQVTANAAGPNPNTVSSSGMRWAIAAYLGASLYDQRDIYDTFDWPRQPDAEWLYATYTRNPFAKPVVDRPAFTSWRDDPAIVDQAEDEQTDFEEDVEKAARVLDLWSYAERLDRLAGIGRYGVMVFVTSDVDSPDDLSTPLEAESLSTSGLDAVNQIKVFSEVSVDNIEWGGIGEASDGRWGKPVSYTIDFSPEAETEEGRTDPTYDVHWTRTVAVPATRLLDDDFFGRPRLEPVINTLRDIEKVLGSIAELAFRGADKGLAISYDPEKIDTTSEDFWDQNDEEMQEWHHGLKHQLETVGDVQELGGDVADASGIFEPQLAALSSATGIPKRVFEGDPAGALASAEEDTQAYFGMIKERRSEYVTPHLVRPMLEWFVDNAIISPPSEDIDRVDVEWPALRVLSEQEQAELANKRLEFLGPAVVVKEAREMHGLEPQPDWMANEVANSYLNEMQAGGAADGPGEALEAALTENRKEAAAAARTQSRMLLGAEGDD
ncbi:anti-CBASS protein Acb1 family protein [Natrarchaeobaculum sulfurireducens]|uniref:Phage portal protein n=1 Tax=Natrarchaeobaculum sulfurireducens TaxID=2044521 RepID=A0A346PMQ1_9EURY|nr:anti-CBASS Acb1 family protein [Natrarchaeobaculum sulfurireducens]AXR80796.1 Phage portal protein [Natrarchaeobaculum sulfurireducens]